MTPAAGQFGASELSDISGFVELPDGKAVCWGGLGKEDGWVNLFMGGFLLVIFLDPKSFLFFFLETDGVEDVI